MPTWNLIDLVRYRLVSRVFLGNRIGDFRDNIPAAIGPKHSYILQPANHLDLSAEDSCPE